jgi:hypothetical protein
MFRIQVHRGRGGGGYEKIFWKNEGPWKIYHKFRNIFRPPPALIMTAPLKQKKRLYSKEYRKQKRYKFEPLQSLISKFHDAVSQLRSSLYLHLLWPILWYKHSVIPVTTFTENNPDVPKSINNVQWLGKTCNKHLKNNKVPPCAAINGLQFPEKSSFFDLNELSVHCLLQDWNFKN